MGEPWIDSRILLTKERRRNYGKKTREKKRTGHTVRYMHTLRLAVHTFRTYRPLCAKNYTTNSLYFPTMVVVLNVFSNNQDQFVLRVYPSPKTKIQLDYELMFHEAVSEMTEISAQEYTW